MRPLPRWSPRPVFGVRPPIPVAVVAGVGQEVRTDARGVAELALAAGVLTDTLEVDVEAEGCAPLHVVFHGERPEGEDR